MSDLVSVLFLTLMGSIVGLSGGLVFLLVKPWSRVLATYSIPFAAGVLMTVSLAGLMPEAVDLIGESAFTIILVSFVCAYLFENLFFDLHHHQYEAGHELHTSSVPLIVVGDTIHNFIDGVTIAAAYIVNPGLGAAAAVSTLLHEIPHEIGDFGVLMKSGFSNRNVFLINFLSSLSSFAGAIVVFFWISGSQFTGTLLSIATGLFLYLGASDFLPKVSRQSERLKSILVVILGIVAMYTTLAIIPHH